MSARKARLSASSRVLLSMTGVLAVAIVVLVALAHTATVQTLNRSIDRALLQESEAFSAAIASAPPGEALDAATRMYLRARTGASSGLAPMLAVRTTGGGVLSNSDLRLEDAVPAARWRSDEPAYATITYEDTRYRVLVVPVMARGTRAGSFLAGLSLRPTSQTAGRLAAILSAAGLIALAVGLVLSYVAAKAALSPLARMADAAARVSGERIDQRVQYSGPADELGSLADSINQMLDRLETAFGEQRRFLADASHELRTPLAVIRGNVELLRARPSSGHGADQELAMIESETVRMTRLIDELLAVARLESGAVPRTQPLRLDTLLTEVAARARSLGGRSVELESQCELWVTGDPDLLEGALMNLVRNAVAHTEPEGRIALECHADNGSAYVAVTDDGSGIPDADLARIFDRFYRSPGSTRSDSGGGAGLGLAITRAVIEAHDGTIEAHNVTPAGARFVVRLPTIAQPD